MAKFGREFTSRVFITASTGIAATHIGGITLHAAMGCGVPQSQKDFERMWNVRINSCSRISLLRYLAFLAAVRPTAPSPFPAGPSALGSRFFSALS